jgi:hypothetical protein
MTIPGRTVDGDVFVGVGALLDVVEAVGVVGVFNGEVARSVLTGSEALTCLVIDGDRVISGVEIEVGDSMITDGVIWILVGRDSADPAAVLRATGCRGAEGEKAVRVLGVELCGAILVYTTSSQYQHPPGSGVSAYPEEINHCFRS